MGTPDAADDVDEHEGVVVGEVDEDVVGRVIGAVPGQLDALTTNLQGCSGRRRSPRRGL